MSGKVYEHGMTSNGDTERFHHTESLEDGKTNAQDLLWRIDFSTYWVGEGDQREVA
jgi:hypothetical protein